MFYWRIFGFFIAISVSIYRLVKAECGPGCQTQCLKAINVYRLNHQALPLQTDQVLVKQAQAWADGGILGTSDWARGKGGECWAFGVIYPHWKATIKAWHDEERNFNWNTMKSIDGSSTGCFLQVIWKGATKVGCGISQLKGEPYYVIQMDKAGVIDEKIHGYEADNAGRPLKPDMNWFDDEVPRYTKGPDGFAVISSAELYRFPQYFGKFIPSTNETEIIIEPKYPRKNGKPGPTVTQTRTYSKTSFATLSYSKASKQSTISAFGKRWIRNKFEKQKK